MDWYFWIIIVLGTLLFIMDIIVFLSRDVIKLRLKAFFLRKGNGVLLVEMAKNRKLNFSVNHIEDNKASKKNKIYGIENRDINLSPQFGIPAVIVNENSTNSVGIDSAEYTALSPTVVDGLIKRVKATAAGEIHKLIKWAFIAFGCICMVLIIQIFVIFKFYAAMQANGISINF